MILGLGHKKQVGKDTVGGILAAEWGFEVLSFADKLKKVALGADPIITETFRLSDVVSQFGWEHAKKHFPEVRLFLQKLGVSCRDHISENVWVDLVDRQLTDRNRNYVVTDVRFQNEARRINEFPYGHMVRVRRPGHGGGDHVSETALDDFAFDYELANDGTIEDLERSVTVMLARLAVKV